MASLVMLGSAWLMQGQAQTIAYSKGQKPAADKIIAIVGDKIILLSDLQNTLVNQQKQYPNLPQNADCMVLEQMMSQNVLTLQAEKDSLPVSDDEVEQQLEHRVRYFESLYGSQQKMEQVLGMSIYQIKDKYRKDIKDIMLAQAEQKKIVDAVKITPTEVEQYFKSIPTDSLPFFKSEVEVGQIVINPKPTPDVVEYIKNQLRGMREEALSGKRSFQTLANLYSKDLATGGKVLTVDRTQHNYDPQFVAAAFRLKNGEISPVFKSQFGYHIVQMVSREGNIAKVRHILLIPPTTQIDIARATGKLDTIRTNILDSKYTFGEAASLYSDDDNIQTGTKNTGGMFIMPDGSTFMSVDDLDPGIVLMHDTLKVGHISAPMVYTPNEHMPEQQSVRIVYLKSRSKPHRENLSEDYSRIQAQALQQKQSKELNDWLEKHASDYYLHVDPKYAGCANIAGWLKKGNGD
jgi:peptidyl-prolyl cis-trans isomerase SurA